MTATQSAWLQTHPQVRLGVESDYAPFVFVDQGAVQGLSMDMLALVVQRTGVVAQAQAPAQLSVLLDDLRAKRLDMATSLRATRDRSDYLLFTRPYVAVPTVVAMRADRTPHPLGGLSRRPVAVGKGYAVEALVRERFPEIDWQALPSDHEALRGVAQGRYDAAVLDAASLAHLRRHPELNSLRAVAPVDFEYRLSFAVRKDWPELLDILDQGIAAIDAQERQAVLARWLEPLKSEAIPARAPVATQLGWLMMAGAALALAGGVAVKIWRVRRSGAGR